MSSDAVVSGVENLTRAIGSLEEIRIQLCSSLIEEIAMSNELTKVYKLSALTAAAALAATTAIALVGAALGG